MPGGVAHAQAPSTRRPAHHKPCTSARWQLDAIAPAFHAADRRRLVTVVALVHALSLREGFRCFVLDVPPRNLPSRAALWHFPRASCDDTISRRTFFERRAIRSSPHDRQVTDRDLIHGRGNSSSGIHPFAARFSQAGNRFRDITPLLANGAAFRFAIDRMADHFRGKPVDAVAATDGGLCFRLALGDRVGRRLLAGYKPAAIPFTTGASSIACTNTTPTFSRATSAINPERAILLVDDLLATGTSTEACCRLIEQAGGHVAGSAS